MIAIVYCLLFIIYYFCVNGALKDIDNLTFIVRLRGGGKALKYGYLFKQRHLRTKVLPFRQKETKML
jgi:hypothetical protein